MVKEKIAFKIDENVRNNTKKCKKNFECLTNKDYKLCKVVSSIKDDVIFIECKEKRNCNYRMSFGTSSFICNCPTRKEIYRKFKK
jgi:hypothetical protein